MDERDGEGASGPEGRRAEGGGGGGKSSRVLGALWLGGFAVAFVLNLLRGRWLTAAFFLAVGFVSLKGRDIEGWPKAARLGFILVYAALALAMLVQLVQDLRRLV